MDMFSKFTPISGQKIRGIQRSDIHSLKKFEESCSELDGRTSLNTIQAWESLVNSSGIGSRSVIAINKTGKIAFYGWFEVDFRVEENLIFLEGRVHPDFRQQGYGSDLLNWLESNAINHLNASGKGKPCTFRIMFYDRAPDAENLFNNRGYKLMYIEQEMQRNLGGSSLDICQEDLEFKSWTEDNKAEFYAVYKAAFQTRTDSLMSSEAWWGHFSNPNDEDFYPENSILVYKSGIPAAYVVVHLDSDPDNPDGLIPWITQIGVDLDFRRNGIGTILLGKTMDGLKKSGYQTVKLSVNVNNPEALSLYNKIGFQTVKSLTMYHKPADIKDHSADDPGVII